MADANKHKLTHGTFAVIRNCCQSGNCFDCTGKTPYGTPRLVKHMDGLSAVSARYVADNWKAYNARVVKMGTFTVDADNHFVETGAEV